MHAQKLHHPISGLHSTLTRFMPQSPLVSGATQCGMFFSPLLHKIGKGHLACKTILSLLQPLHSHAFTMLSPPYLPFLPSSAVILHTNPVHTHPPLHVSTCTQTPSLALQGQHLLHLQARVSYCIIQPPFALPHPTICFHHLHFPLHFLLPLPCTCTLHPSFSGTTPHQAPHPPLYCLYSLSHYSTKC